MGDKKLPFGIENFDEFYKEKFYYVDKTEFIAKLLYSRGEVNLFTRPRQFGKSLNMSMLKAFFEIDCNKMLFEELKISQEKELCEKYMGQFPVISISMKDVNGVTYEAARTSVKHIVGNEARRFGFLAQSELLSEAEKYIYKALVESDKCGDFIMSDTELAFGLKTLSSLLYKHFGKQAIILIDEYDAPLHMASKNGYYKKMLMLLASIYGNALKTNPDLYFAVLTGVFTFPNESVISGLNNISVYSITDARFDKYFGFTDEEVKQMLDYYELTEYYGVMKEWYGDYRFGKEEIYCPRDVISYCELLCRNPYEPPQIFWSSRSGNTMVQRLIDKATAQTRYEIEQLIAGENIVKEIHQNFTYKEMDTTIERLWSVLLNTGYLTHRGRKEDNRYYLAIPNMEIRKIFIRNISGGCKA